MTSQICENHATKTGVHHLKNSVHHFYTFQKCTVWTNEESSIIRYIVMIVEAHFPSFHFVNKELNADIDFHAESAVVNLSSWVFH